MQQDRTFDRMKRDLSDNTLSLVGYDFAGCLDKCDGADDCMFVEFSTQHPGVPANSECPATGGGKASSEATVGCYLYAKKSEEADLEHIERTVERKVESEIFCLKSGKGKYPLFVFCTLFYVCKISWFFYVPLFFEIFYFALLQRMQNR